MWEDYNYHRPLLELLRERDTKKKGRPLWMNTPEFLAYEIDYMKYWIQQYELDRDEARWQEYREAAISAAKCPLCRR